MCIHIIDVYINTGLVESYKLSLEFRWIFSQFFFKGCSVCRKFLLILHWIRIFFLLLVWCFILFGIIMCLIYITTALPMFSQFSFEISYPNTCARWNNVICAGLLAANSIHLEVYNFRFPYYIHEINNLTHAWLLWYVNSSYTSENKLCLMTLRKYSPHIMSY